MPVPISGEPVRISFQSSTTSTTAGLASTVSLGLYIPQTSTARLLQPYEAVVITSVLMCGGVNFNGFNIITELPGGTPSSQVSQANIMLSMAASQPLNQDWHDDGTGAMTGLPGVIPSFWYNDVGTAGEVGITYITGTGLIVQCAPSLSRTQGSPRNPQFANLTQNSTGNA